MNLLNFNIFRNAMGFSSALFPSKQIVFDAGMKPGEHVLLYGEVSNILIKQTLKTIGRNAKLYVIGRNQQLLTYRKFTRGKYQKCVVVNPFFEDLPENCLNLILIVNAIINIENIPTLAVHAKKVLKANGRISIIDDNTSWDELIKLAQNFNWLKNSSDRKILTFEKQ